MRFLLNLCLVITIIVVIAVWIADAVFLH